MNLRFDSRDFGDPSYQFRALAGNLLPLVILLLCVLLYLIPNAIELLLARSGAPAVVLLLIGNVAGCAVIAAVLSFRWAFAVYLISFVMEAWLLRFERVSPFMLAWVTDLLPTAFIAGLVIDAARRGQNWRRDRSGSRVDSGTVR